MDKVSEAVYAAIYEKDPVKRKEIIESLTLQETLEVLVILGHKE